MRTFNDNSGRTWTVSINIASVKRVRSLVSVDLLSLPDDGLAGLGKLLSDIVVLADVIYCLCKDQADKTGVSDEDFGRAMAGDAIGNATDAFLGELADFFPDPRVRAGIQKILTLSRKVTDQVLMRSAEQIDQIDVDSLVTKLIEQSGRSRVLSE